MKLLDIFKTASSNIWQSKLRTFLTIVAIFIGAFTLTLTTGIGAGISQYIDGQVSGIGAKNILIITAKSQSTATGNSTDPQKYDASKVTISQQRGPDSGTVVVLGTADIAKLKGIAGITDVRPLRSVTPSYVVGTSGEKYVLSVSEYIDGTNVAMSAGAITSNTATDLQIALPYNYVSVLGFSSYADAVGKQVTIGVADSTGAISEVVATISGVPEKSFIGSSSANVNTALFDKLYAIQNAELPANALGKYTAAIAHFDTSYSDAQVTDLKDKLDKDGYQGQTVADQIATVKTIINGIVIVFDVFAIIALLAASFGVINTLLMSVQERTKEIGLMKAMGMGRGRIFLLFSSEAILLGFWGSFVGVLAAMGAGQLINRFASSHFLKDFEGLHLLAFPAVNVVEIILGIMLIAFLAGTLPARRASGLNPIDALRYE